MNPLPFGKEKEMQKTEQATSCATDHELVTKMQAGAKGLFEVLIRRHNGVLYKVGRSFGLLHDDVQDLMQETHIAAYLNLSKFENRSAYKTWLIRIMLNKCYHWTMERENKGKRPLADAHHLDGVPRPEAASFSDGHRVVLKRNWAWCWRNA